MSNSTVTWYENKEITLWQASTEGSWGSNNWRYDSDNPLATNDYWVTKTLSFSAVFYSKWINTPATLYYSLDGGTNKVSLGTLYDGNNTKSASNLSFPDGWNFGFWYQSSTSPTAYRVSANIYIAGNSIISKNIFTHKSLPREEKELWNKCKTTLFWYHTDNTWYEWE